MSTLSRFLHRTQLMWDMQKVLMWFPWLRFEFTSCWTAHFNIYFFYMAHCLVGVIRFRKPGVADWWKAIQGSWWPFWRHFLLSFRSPQIFSLAKWCTTNRWALVRTQLSVGNSYVTHPFWCVTHLRKILLLIVGVTPLVFRWHAGEWDLAGFSARD